MNKIQAIIPWVFIVFFGVAITIGSWFLLEPLFRAKKCVKSHEEQYVELPPTINVGGGQYGGGVGGITIPINKAIAQWNKARTADLDVFGHFHQRLDGGNFVANGSLIGYNAYALSIKASWERPQQTFFLLNSKVGKTIVAPIILGEV